MPSSSRSPTFPIGPTEIDRQDTQHLDRYAFSSCSPGLRLLADAPALDLRRIDGETIQLKALRGKVVLLSFWATWCPPCRRELPTLERLGLLIDPRDLEIVAISIDKG
ncbi:TlpA family protein disulfide reductase, partial [Methylosinus sp. Sm6]|nr:TlpA family protein disulfide reductase [Methylosinus sp. Sm6]